MINVEKLRKVRKIYETGTYDYWGYPEVYERAKEKEESMTKLIDMLIDIAENMENIHVDVYLCERCHASQSLYILNGNRIEYCGYCGYECLLM